MLKNIGERDVAWHLLLVGISFGGDSSTIEIKRLRGSNRKVL
jgi:hypothetical protein